MENKAYRKEDIDAAIEFISGCNNWNSSSTPDWFVRLAAVNAAATPEDNAEIRYELNELQNEIVCDILTQIQPGQDWLQKDVDAIMRGLHRMYLSAPANTPRTLKDPVSRAWRSLVSDPPEDDTAIIELLRVGTTDDIKERRWCDIYDTIDLLGFKWRYWEEAAQQDQAQNEGWESKIKSFQFYDGDGWAQVSRVGKRWSYAMRASQKSDKITIDEILESRTQRGEALAAAAKAARESSFEMFVKMRQDGWTLAVHTDYRLNGKPHTFYLWTHEETDRFVNGEAVSDYLAMELCLDAAAIREQAE